MLKDNLRLVETCKIPTTVRIFKEILKLLQDILDANNEDVKQEKETAVSELKSLNAKVKKYQARYDRLSRLVQYELLFDMFTF